MSQAPVLSTEPEFETVAPLVRETPSNEHLNKYYCLPELSEYLNSHDYKSIALQFPANDVADSALVVRLLKQTVDPSISLFILADTNYSPCCVDVVGANHIKADLVVHFGSACLNPVTMPVIYVFCNPAIDTKIMVEQLSEQIKESEQPNILLDSDSKYYPEMPSMFKALQDAFPDKKIVRSFIPNPQETLGLSEKETKPESEEGYLYRRTHADLDPQETMLIYVGTPSSSLALHYSTRFGATAYFNPVSGQAETPKTAIMKRYRYMNMARAAQTIGILINSLSMSETKEMSKKLQKAITESGKKSYTFVVGKPNVAKLANFEVVDVWAVFGCGIGGIILENEEQYFKPVVSVYELGLALQPELSWTGEWEIDSNKVDLNVELDEDEADEPFFNPVTGKFIDHKPLHVQEYSDDEETQALVKSMGGALTIKNTVTTAAIQLQQREWQGLGHDYGSEEEEGADLEEGRGGIARGYAVGDDERM
ncbi:Diphthamide biosynthesis protein 2 [Yarrowia sp. C11]|nr:Diphthamide biosynthesis protein 2 [Yarrowia sp. E02]KAG5369894.1 Diphthamide biosynthesis protein 2 [Yarrowia sp. C11]